MTEFDPEKFEDKYVHYFTELQQAYKNAFEVMNDEYDSEVVHAIDQFVLNESEPFYVGDGEFEIELPDEPFERVSGNVLVDREKFDGVLEIYIDQLEEELRAVFDLSDQPKA